MLVAKESLGGAVVVVIVVVFVVVTMVVVIMVVILGLLVAGLPGIAALCAPESNGWGGLGLGVGDGLPEGLGLVEAALEL